VFFLAFILSQNNMLIRPTEAELAEFGEPDFIIYNAGQFPANRFTKGMSSTTSVEINFKRMEMVILGTEYAGEMKKGVFSVMVGGFGFLHNSVLQLMILSITSNQSSLANFLFIHPQMSE
jgi:ATP-dependent phosphoenolpyruvate carboxykinase